ncbi:MAG TPA: amidohydrolase family protein [Dehalococcoidia bacterium]|nr:amidohydrolase family protein [Dehalococcoidia bacterium]
MTTTSPYRIFDLHQHVQETIRPQPEGGYDIEEDLRYRLQIMDKHGIRTGALLASLLYERPEGIKDTRRMNDFVAWYRDNHRDRFPVGIGTVDPLQGEAAGVAELERMATELRLQGAVWHHHFSGVDIADRRMGPFLRTLAKHNLPALIHVRGYSHESTWSLETLAKRVPEATIIAMCPMNGLQQMRELQGVGERCPNIMFNTSLLWPLNNWIERFTQWFGSERIIFGTDLHFHPKPSYLRPPGLDQILVSQELNDEDKRNILWRNAERLFPVLQTYS